MPVSERGHQHTHPLNVMDSVGKGNLLGKFRAGFLGADLEIGNHDHPPVSINDRRARVERIAAFTDSRYAKSANERRHHIVGMPLHLHAQLHEFVHRQRTAQQQVRADKPADQSRRTAAQPSRQRDVVALLHPQPRQGAARFFIDPLHGFDGNIRFIAGDDIHALSFDMNRKSPGKLIEFDTVVEIERDPKRIKSRAEIGRARGNLNAHKRHNDAPFTRIFPMNS